MNYDNELILISKTYTEDQIGNQVAQENIITILCSVKSIGRNEFYSAATNGLKPEIIFIIHSYEYDGQTEVEFNQLRYKVIRTFSSNFEELELIAERVISNV